MALSRVRSVLKLSKQASATYLMINCDTASGTKVPMDDTVYAWLQCTVEFHSSFTARYQGLKGQHPKSRRVHCIMKTVFDQFET